MSEIYKTIVNDDGSYTIQYADTFVDLNGFKYTVLVSTKTRLIDDLKLDIDSFRKRIEFDQEQLDSLQQEMDAVNQAGGK